MTEINGNARVAAADALIAAGFVDPDDGTVPRWNATEPVPVWTNPMQVVDVVIAAALPHLRVQETGCQGNQRGSGKACDCPGCTPAPRPVVDREAVVSLLQGPNACGRWVENLLDDDDQAAIASAVLALLPTEEDTKGQHGPIGVLGTDVGPFIKCSCGKNPTPKIWLEEHWAGDPETGKQLVRQFLPASHDAMGDGS